MNINKWNYKKHIYERQQIPDGWNCKSYSNDMDEIINCPHCGKKIKVGDSYTSLEFHTEMGFGYMVCEACYEEESERRRKNEKI